MFLRVFFIAPAPVLLLSNSGTGGLKARDKAPEVVLPYATKDTVSPPASDLSASSGRATLFLPADWPPDRSGGCTTLSDHHHVMAKEYQSENEKSGFNLRSVYIPDARGSITYRNRSYTSNGPESFDALRNALAKVK